jgi:hypothetical protein
VYRAFTIILICAATAFAQGRGVRARTPAGNLNLTSAQSIEGPVTAIHLAYGAQYPSLVIGDKTIKIAPIWFFADHDFEIRIGDSLRVLAASSRAVGDSYLYALRITNTKTQLEILLRDEAGVPLWAAQGPKRTSRSLHIQPGLTSIFTVTGRIEAVVYGPGIQMPSITIRTAEGSLITAVLGPERVLLELDVELKVGQDITAKLAVCNYRDGYLVLELTLADGTTIVLRDSTGAPVWP